MAAKTTSGSGFLFRFAFSTVNLVDLARNLKNFLGTLFGEIWAQSFENLKII